MVFGMPRAARKGQKGQGMALETVFKVLILIVTVVVIVGLIFRFSDQIKNQVTAFLDQILGKKQGPTDFPKTIERDSFTSSEIANYAETCYNSMTSLPPADQKDTNCFILVGSRFSANANDVMNNLSQSIKSHVTITADFSRGVIIIDFVDIGDKIIVR